MAKKGPAARYLENIHLQEEVDSAAREVQKQGKELEALRSQVGDIDSGRPLKRKLLRYWKFILALLVCIVLTVLATLVAVWAQSRNVAFPSSDSEASSQEKKLSLQLPIAAGSSGKSSLNFGVRLDNQLQECQESHWKRSFPDLDYAFFGYDIITGYPLATGHDPGLTHPIFKSDYSLGRQTSDCRYSVPRGLIIVPDVSCVTSFSSKLIRNKLEMSKSLEVAANVEGGGWGFKFSASASYKESVAQMSSGEFLYIISQAQCRYYFSTLDLTDPPPFHPGFLTWAERLAASDVTENEIIEFIKYYGTHFLSEVTFGARFVKNHKISQTKYEEIRNKKISVQAQASYSGAFSVGGGFSMDSEQRSAASNFQKSVETSTSTIGAAPPSDGDALTWAASVQENPVPTKYKLSAIHNLFTEKFTAHLDSRINFTAIKERLRDASKNYCEILKREGKVDSCEDSIQLGTSLSGIIAQSYGYRILDELDETECRALCLQEEDCVAAEYRHRSDGIKRCEFLNTKRAWKVKKGSTSKIVVFLPRLQREKKTFILDELKVNTNEQRAIKMVSKIEECSLECAKDAFCRAFVMCNPNGPKSWCKTTKGNCYLYSEMGIKAVEVDENSEMHFVWKNYTQAEEA